MEDKREPRPRRNPWPTTVVIIAFLALLGVVVVEAPCLLAFFAILALVASPAFWIAMIALINSCSDDPQQHPGVGQEVPGVNQHHED